MGANITAADYATGLRALADALEEHGLPQGDRHPKQGLGMTLFVESVADVEHFAATHDVPVEVNGTHTRAELVVGPNPDPYRNGSACLAVVHIDHSDEPEDAPAEDAVAPAVEPTGVDEYRCPEPGCDYHVFAAGPLDPDEPDYFTEGIEEHERGHEHDDEPVGALTGEPSTVAPLPPMRAGFRPALADAVSAARLALAPSSTPALVQLDWEEDVQAKLVAVGEAARAWHAADPNQPEGIEAEAVLSDAVSAYVAVMVR